MKKILLSLIIILMLSACATNNETNTLTLEETYEKAVETINEASSIDGHIYSKVTFNIGELSQTQNIIMDIKTNNAKDIKDLETSIKVQIDGTGIETYTYAKDGFMYIDVMGQKFKTPLDSDDEEINNYTNQLNLETYNPDMIKNLKSEKSGNYTTISFDIDESKILDLNQIDEEMKDVINESNLTQINSSGSIKLDKDGNVVSNSIYIEMELSVEGETMKIINDSTITYNQVNDVIIELPNDLDTYMLVED